MKEGRIGSEPPGTAQVVGQKERKRKWKWEVEVGGRKVRARGIGTVIIMIGGGWGLFHAASAMCEGTSNSMTEILVLAINQFFSFLAPESTSPSRDVRRRGKSI